MWKFFLTFLMFAVTPADGFCCVWFIHLIVCWFLCPEIGTSYIDLAQLNRFHLKSETESSLRNLSSELKHDDG
jgi:hypothetical protein